MKKFFYSVLAASMLFATSCSHEDIVDITKGEGQKVTFKVNLPEQAASRAAGDGTKATDLIFAMYEEGTNTVLISGDTADDTVNPERITKNENGSIVSFTVEVPMAKEIKYDLLFLAYNKDYCAFDIEDDPQETNLKDLRFKTNLDGNQDAYDAFVGVLKSNGIKDIKNIALTRPFAQVNAVTTAKDWANVELLASEITSSVLTIQGVPSTYDVFNEKATGSMNVSFSPAAPLDEELDGYDDYKHLALGYVLAGDNTSQQTSTATAEFIFYRADNKPVSSLVLPNFPLERNHRTNVVGSLLTSIEEYTVTINPIPLDSDHTPEVDNAGSVKDVQTSEDWEEVAALLSIPSNEPISIKLGGNSRSTGDKIIQALVPATICEGNTVFLDLNGYTLSGTCNADEGYLIMVENGAVLTIQDSSEEKTGKITYSGDNSTGWVIDLEGELNLYSGTIELTGSWNIGYAVDVRPNAWGTAYTKPTTFHMYDGKLVSSDGAIRVASSSYDSYTNVSANFIMDGGKIDAVWDGLFIQQSNTCYDILNVIINGGTIEGEMYPIRLYGPSATSVVGDKKIATTLEINGGTISGGTTASETRTWLVENILCIGGGMTDDDLQYAKINIDGKVWITNGLWKKDNEYLVENANGLAFFSAKALTGNNGTAEEATIKIMNDIDMQDAEFSAIIAQRGDKLTIVGNGHTISNVRLVSGENDNTTGQASMFYAYPNSTLTVADLKLKSITVTADENATGYAAAIVGYCEGKAILNNVDVENATITGVKSSGMLVGHLSGSLKAEGCDLSGTVTLTVFAEETNGHYAGKYIGTLAGPATINNCTVVVTVSGNLNSANVGDEYGRKTEAGTLNANNEE